MNFFEIQIFIVYLSFFFVWSIWRQIPEDSSRQEFLFLWITLFLLDFFLGYLLLSRLAPQSSIHYLNRFIESQIYLWLGFTTVGAKFWHTGLLRRFVCLGIIILGFRSFGIVWTNLRPEFLFGDGGGFVSYFLILGTFAWMAEMFWYEKEEPIFHVSSPLLPWLVFPMFLGLLWSGEKSFQMWQTIALHMFVSFSGFLGFRILTKAREEHFISIGFWLGGVFSGVFPKCDLAVSLPLVFGLGIIGAILARFLQNQNWSRVGVHGFLSFFFPAVFSSFSYLFVEKLQPHPFYLMLGVQSLLVLGSILFAAGFFLILTLLRPKFP